MNPDPLQQAREALGRIVDGAPVPTVEAVEIARTALQALPESLGERHSVQRDVEEFHREVVGIPDSTTPQIRRPELRAELIREEARETVEAIERGDLVEAIDGMCDILAVVYGTAAEFGINLAPFWDEVHRTNMAKKDGPVREDGKRLKPEGWQPPDIAGLLAALPDPSPKGAPE